MPGVKDLLRVASEWVSKAEDHIKTAAHTLKLGRTCPTGAVCFHAQQCAEKYLKAYLVSQKQPFPKTHDIEELVSRLSNNVRPSLSPEEQALLSEYAVGPRYPGWRDVPFSEARRALALARRVRKHVRALLPRDALHRRHSHE
jgi:HEPN domain-containing protein